MNAIDIMNAIDAIKALPICELEKRQSMLIDLLVEMVNSETCDGELTELHMPLECQDWWTTLKCLTTDAGFTMLGNGHFSAAYSHPLLPNRVIKVGFKKEDSGAAYIAFCRMYQGRAGIPNVYDVQRHAGCYTVVLDALNECEREDNYEHDKYADIASEVIDYNSDMHDWRTGWDGEFVETCKLIRKFFEGIASFDMHSGNIMFDDNDVPYITDPVSFSHDREREDGFPLDPEALLAEVEAVAQERMIERCRNRKAKRDPNGTYWINKKANMKRRKRNRKHAERVVKRDRLHFMAIRRERGVIERNERRAEMLMGSAWHDFWLRNGNSTVRKIDQVNGLKWKLGDHLAIQAGLPLNIDKLLDAQLQG